MRALRGAGIRDVRAGRTARAVYSSDASLYRVVPQAVVLPREAAEVQAALSVARSLGVSITPRGAGTSVAGNAIGPGIVLDFSRHMNRLLDLDPERRTASVEPGLVLAHLQRAAAPHGLRFGRPVYTEPRHARRHDRQRRLWLPVACLWPHLSQRDRARPAHRQRRAARDPSHHRWPSRPRLRGRPGPSAHTRRRAPRRGPHRTGQLRPAALGLCSAPSAAREAVRPDRPPRRERGNTRRHHPSRCPARRGARPPGARRARVPKLRVRGDATPDVLAHRPTACEGLDRRIVDVVRERRGHQAVPALPRGEAWLLVELSGDDPAELPSTAASSRAPRRRRVCGRSAPTGPGWQDGRRPESPPGRDGRTRQSLRGAWAPTCVSSSHCSTISG